jgi:RNA polymerase sigma factor (sigma-70 family)
LEASALTHASQRGLLARRSPLLKLQGDAKLIAMARSGNTGAFETIVDRYQARLLGFCRQMLHSTEDAEDVLQEVFVNAYRAMLADEREINLRPWLYRIARNRCLNHLRKPTADAQESMDMVPVVEAASTAEKVSNREEFRQLLTDVGKLPETQRTALLLREMDAMSYEEIAAAMETSVPSVKSLLVRARISLAEASQARQLTCGEVRLELAEAAEGLRKVSGPVRRHVRDCDECSDFRSQVRSNDKVMAALFPVGALVALKGFIVGKLGLGGAGGAGAGATGGAGAAGAGAGATASAGATATAGATAAATATGVGGVGAALGGGGAAGGIGAIGGAVGTKAVAGVVTAAVITAGAVEVNQNAATGPLPKTNPPAQVANSSAHRGPLAIAPRHAAPPAPPQPVELAVAPAPPAPAPAPAPEPVEPAPAPVPAPEEATGGTEADALVKSEEDEDSKATAKVGGPKVTAAKSPGEAGAPTGTETVVVTVGGSTPPPSAVPAEEAPAPAPPAESPPPAESTPPPSNPPATDPPEESTPPPAVGGESGSEASTTPTPAPADAG